MKRIVEIDDNRVADAFGVRFVFSLRRYPVDRLNPEHKVRPLFSSR